MITYKYIGNTLENIKAVEKLRHIVFNLGTFSSDSVDYKELKENKKLIFAAFNDDEIIASAYVSNTFDSIFIDYLFVNKDYQETGLKVGRNLLSYILSQKEFIENFYGRKFNYSKIEYIDDKTKTIYMKFGYNKENKILGILRRNI